MTTYAGVVVGKYSLTLSQPFWGAFYAPIWQGHFNLVFSGFLALGILTLLAGVFFRYNYLLYLLKTVLGGITPALLGTARFTNSQPSEQRTSPN
jgi:hypothetical protein